MKNILFIVFCFLLSFLYGQEPSFRVIGKEELSGYDIYDIVQNEEGIIILGTNNGVYKYDGASITKLKSPKLKDKSFFGFKLDNNNQLYCYNLIGEIYKVTDDSISHYTTIPEDYLTDYFSFEFTDKNELIFSFVKPIKRDIYGKYAMLFEELSNEYFANSIHKLEDGRIVLFNSTTKTVYIHQSDNDWKHIEIKEPLPLNHKVSISSDGKYIYILDHITYTVYKINDFAYEIIHLEQPKDNPRIDLFAVYTGGRFSLSISGGGILLFNPDGSARYGGQVLFDEYIFSGFLTDKEGNQWVTTLENAILFFNKSPIVTYVNEPILKDEFISKVSYCTSGQLYIGTMSGKIIIEEQGVLKLFHDNKPHRINYLEHKKDHIYVSRGAFSTRNEVKEDVIGPNAWLINSDFEQVGDTFFYATSKGLIFENASLKIDSVLLKARVDKLEYVKETNTLWAATNKGLFYYLNDTLVKSSLLENLSIPIGLQQYKNKLWVATESDGILLFSGNKIITQLTTSNGLLSQEVRKILCVKDRLFISHSKGLQIYDIPSKTFRIINTSDGLLANNVRDFDVFENYLAILTHQGLQKLDFSKLEIEGYKPNVLFTRIASKEGILYDDFPELDYSNNSIIFQFTSYAYRYDISYKYRLIKDDIDVGWNKQEFSSNIMHYPSLSPGNYTFQVKAVTDHLHESDIISYHFSIKHPFWETIPFWILVVVIFVQLIRTFYKYTVKKVQKDNQLKAELYTSKLTALKSQMNPHFIFNSLNSIQALILKEDVKNSYNYIVKFSTLVRNTLNYSDKSFIDFEEEIELLQMYLDLEKLRFKEDFDYKITIHGSIKGFVPPMLIQPFVENAIKHGLLHSKSKKELTIDFKLEDVLICYVQDNGIGREKSMEIKKRQGRQHEAFSVNALNQRFVILNEIYGLQIGFKIIDLKLDGKAIGTRVEIRIPFKSNILELSNSTH